MNKKIFKKINSSGDIIVFALVFMSIFLIMASGLLGVVNLNRKFTLQKISKTNALEIAEAGINYYRWHLAHNPYDYSDGQNGVGCNPEPPFTCGPYTHNYLNDLGQKIGSFELEITPSPAGSTIITIASTGWVDKFSLVKRTITARFGVPSLAEYSFLEDSPMTFSATSETWGKIHSNYRIEFNGINHSTVESAEPTNGVWGTGGPKDLWYWPVPAIDFNKITQDLSLIKTEAQRNGIYLRKTNREGYHLILNENNSVDIFEVRELRRPSYYFDIQRENFLENRPLENVNLIFVEDNLWLEGIVNNLLTIASARFPDNPNTNTTIYISGNIIYASRGAEHILGLIAQKDIFLTYGVPDTTIINAHLLAQKGYVRRYCYWSDLKDSLTIYGGIISKKGGGFKCLDWDGNVISGFIDTYYQANPEAIYHPPPMFPISATSTLLSWEEIE